jgi:hypothetical protein
MDPSFSSLEFGSRLKVNMYEKVCRRTRLKYRLVRYLKGKVCVRYMREAIHVAH